MKSILGVMLLSVLLLSCSKEPAYRSLVQGEWVIDAALRTGKPTNTLNGLYFAFKDDSLYSNIQSIQSSTFAIHSDTISILSTPALAFHIESIDSSHMHLNGWIQKTHFILKFTKTKNYED